MTTIKQCKDGFIWLVLTKQQAQIIYKYNIFNLYVLYEDESEALIEDYNQIEAHIEAGRQIGIEVGYASKRQYNDTRRKANKATR